MTHRERAITALNMGISDYIPTFELEYQLAPEVFGGEFLHEEELKGLSEREKDYKIEEGAEFMIRVFSELEYSIWPIHWLSEENTIKTAKIINKKTNGSVLLTHHGDGTFSIPDGNKMYEFAYRTADDPEGLLEEARIMAEEAKERNRRLFDAGIESFILCADYCYNSGPFISPLMFAEYITPFLADIIGDIRSMGGYAIKHTDGNIMPILDQLLEAKPHAIHSLDPMAKVDIGEVKRLTFGKCAIIGNVNCALMQTGTDEEVAQSAMYAIEKGKPGGGYIFSTSNVPFRGLPKERYQMILDIWKKYRSY